MIPGLHHFIMNTNRLHKPNSWEKNSKQKILFFLWLKFFFFNVNLKILNTLRQIIDIISLLCSDSGAMKAGDPAVLFNSASSPSNTSATPKSAICPYKISNCIFCFLAKTYYALCL